MARRSGGVRQMQPPQRQGRGATKDSRSMRRLGFDNSVGMAIASNAATAVESEDETAGGRCASSPEGVRLDAEPKKFTGSGLNSRSEPEHVPMPDSLGVLFLYTLIPCIGLLAGAAYAVATAPPARLVSAFQHFAAGVVFAAVAVELLPQLHAHDAPVAMVVGFCLGVGAMLAAKVVFENAGIVIPIGIDLFIDGVLIALGFAAGVKGGMVLLVGLTLETLSLGLSTAPSLVRSGLSRTRVVLLAGVAGGIVVLAGAGVGFAIVGLSGSLLAGILGFGVAALLYLVTEELLTEAHESADTPIVTATFFAGFLLPLLFEWL
jgi:zinc transporter, ZIP family